MTRRTERAANPSPRPPREPLAEVDLAPGSAIIADLHLDVADATAVEGFCAWLERLPPCPRLVILGDLFEFWLGPAHERLPGAQRVLAGLRSRARAGCAIELVHGNRDFLLDASFARAAGVRIRPEGLLGRLPGGGSLPQGRVLLIHGDELCTLDHGYQRLKRVLRSRFTRALARKVPMWMAERLALRLRRASRGALAAKAPLEVEQQPDAVHALCAHSGCATLVCGHAHRWRDERLAGGRRWIVLDAFGGEHAALVVGPAGELKPLEPATDVLGRG